MKTWNPIGDLPDLLIVGDTKLALERWQVEDWYELELVYPCDVCNGYHLQEDH